jgi:broad specificity phosphatase PhoE
MLNLLRCGETHWEREERLHGWTDLPLTAAGRASVTSDIAHAHGVHIATIHHPDDDAATETATLWSRACSARTKSAPDLADPNLGLFEGMLEQDLAERHPKRHKQWTDDPLSLVPPEGEPIADARARLLRASAKLLKKTRATEIAFVLHPIAFGLLRCRLAERPADDLWRILADGRRVERYAFPTAWLDRLLEPVASVT